MRVVLSTYASRGGVEPLVGLAVQLQALGVEVRVCAPPDQEFAQRLAGFGISVVGVGPSVRALMTVGNPSEQDLRRHVDDLIAAQFDVVATVADGCDAVVATTQVWTAAGTRSVAEKLGIHYVYASYHPAQLPSPHYPPPAYWGLPFQAFKPDNRVLWGLDAQSADALIGPTLNGHRAAIGLPPVDNVRDYAYTDRPWLASDPSLAPWLASANLDVVQTGAWLVPDDRPLSADLVAFLDAGAPPVYLGFGGTPSSIDVVRLGIRASRAQGRRVLLSRGWAGLDLIDDSDDCFVVGEVNQQALFGRVAAVVHHGGAGTTTAAARAGVPQLVVPHGRDQFYWADRVAALGIGGACDGRTTTVESFSALLALALAADTRARVDQVSGTIRTDGAQLAARLLVEAIAART